MTHARLVLAAGSIVWAAGPAAGEEKEISQDELRGAIDRGLAVVQRSAAEYPTHRRCFSCHHQTLPMLAMVTARRAGLAIDEALLKSQTEFTHDFFTKRSKDLRGEKGIGGGAMTVGYGLWALDLVRHEPDETTDAMVDFLLKRQKKEGHWRLHSNRPPLEESGVTETVMSVRFARKFGRKAVKPQIEEMTGKANEWLAGARIESQEDLNSWASGLALLGGAPNEVRRARELILMGQRPDGGWGQLPKMDADAYSTGQTLFVLQAMRMPSSHPAIQRGLRFLLKTQAKDGSWFVQTRSEPIQVFFDNGDPYGESQFISITATGWAVTALAQACERGVSGEE